MRNNAVRGWRFYSVNQLECEFKFDGDIAQQGGGKSAAIAYTLIETAKLNGVDPQAWFTDTLARIADHKIIRLSELMPWCYAAVEE